MQTRFDLEPAGTRRMNIAHAGRDSDASATRNVEIRTTKEVGVYQESEGRRENMTTQGNQKPPLMMGGGTESSRGGSRARWRKARILPRFSALICRQAYTFSFRNPQKQWEDRTSGSDTRCMPRCIVTHRRFEVLEILAGCPHRVMQWCSTRGTQQIIDKTLLPPIH